jgi:D-aminoacyl-tRNA deacylase
MVVLIISSTEDPASTNIKEHLLKQSIWEEMGTFNKKIVYRNSDINDLFIVTINDKLIMHENIDKEIEDKLGIKPKQAIYISRHRSKTGKPTLTVHPIGNYGEARFGGQNKILSKSSPKLMAKLIRIIKKRARQANLYHKICLEVTHHGPCIKIPSLFVEVGSNEDEWKKQKPAEIIAKSVLELLEQYHYEEDFEDGTKVLIGIGGGHYAPRFTDIIFEKKAAFGHMIPAYHLDSDILDTIMFEKALEGTPNVKGVYIHKKSLKKSQVRKIKEWFNDNGIPVLSSKDLPKID